MATASHPQIAASSSVRDRLVTTLFAAAMLHGIVIAGITFSSSGKDGAAPGLDVLIVSDEVPEADRNDDAQYLSQRTQLGGGSTRAKVPPRSPASRPDTPRIDGDRNGTALAARRQSTENAEPAVLTTTAQQTVVRWLGDLGAAGPAGSLPLQMDAHRAAGSAGRDDDGRAQLSGPARSELWITPNTRASQLAPWLDAWRRKVERLGTLNYPAAARQVGAHANPVVEVTIASDGNLVEAQIRRSSGQPEVDRAALDILRLASPFDALPAELQHSYSVLRFAYEWEFDGDGASGGALSVPDTP